MSIIRYRTEHEEKSKYDLIEDMYKQHKRIKKLEKEKEKLDEESCKTGSYNIKGDEFIKLFLKR